MLSEAHQMPTFTPQDVPHVMTHVDVRWSFSTMLGICSKYEAPQQKYGNSDLLYPSKTL